MMMLTLTLAPPPHIPTAVGQAYKMVQDEDQMNIINAKLDEAKHLAQVKLEEKRLEAKRKGLKAIPEDNPVVVSCWPAECCRETLHA